MHFYLSSVLATVALSVGLELTSASFAGHIHHTHRHVLRAHPQGRYHQLAPKAYTARCAASQVDLQAFQVETEAFHKWISAWLDTADEIGPESAIAQVKQEFQAYNLWVNEWLDSHIPVEDLPPFPTSAQPTLPVVVTAISTNANGLTATPKPVPSQPAIKSKKIVVYYGQSPATANTTLAQVCDNKNVDMVILAFLTHFAGPGGYPTLNFGAACGGQTQQMLSAGAAGLLSCPLLASYITKCQGMGKKVLLSLGGGVSDVALPDDKNAKTVAKQLWNLFGAGKGEDPGLRPFGNVTLDGFDIDNEDHSTAHYSTFVSALRENMDNEKSRKYYISAAPQCPRPDASIPLDAMQIMDFIFVQFYNNPPCGLGSSGFIESFQAWSKDLSVPDRADAGPKLYIGMPGCPVPGCSGSGYLGGEELKKTMEEVNKIDVKNFGGVMLWEGPLAMKNHAEGGQDYLTVVKAFL